MTFHTCMFAFGIDCCPQTEFNIIFITLLGVKLGKVRRNRGNHEVVMGKYVTVGIVMLWLCVVHGCPKTCKGRTCEDWFQKDGITCVQLELVRNNKLSALIASFIFLVNFTDAISNMAATAKVAQAAKANFVDLHASESLVMQ